MDRWYWSRAAPGQWALAPVPAVGGAATVRKATQRITRIVADTPDLARIIAQALAAARD